jgi:hypothetical protein
MIQIGALCYSSVFLFRDDLKRAIMSHPLWKPTNPDSPPIFDVYVGDFIASSKKTKMLFVSAEKSRKEEVVSLFKTIYDDTSKSYPNGAMMLFIPTIDIATSSNDFQAKILFNHEKYIGDVIGGFNNLNTSITLQNGKCVTIQYLLKSLLPLVSLDPKYFNRWNLTLQQWILS